jgi:hypothetical protein
MNLSPVLTMLKMHAPLIAVMIGGPLECVAVSLLCAAFDVPPERLVDTMLDQQRRNELGSKLESIVIK